MVLSFGSRFRSSPLVRGLSSVVAGLARIGVLPCKARLVRALPVPKSVPCGLLSIQVPQWNVVAERLPGVYVYDCLTIVQRLGVPAMATAKRVDKVLNKSELLAFRVDAEAAVVLKRAALRDGMRLSDWLRRAASNAVKYSVKQERLF